jgi:hypothetical protein
MVSFPHSPSGPFLTKYFLSWFRWFWWFRLAEQSKPQKGPGNRSNETAVSLFRCVLGLRVQVSPLHRSSTTIITPSTIIPVTSIIDHRPSRIISRHLILANAACRIPPAPPTLSVYIRCRSASQQDARRQSPFVVVFASCKMQVGKFVLSLGRGKLACRKVNSPRIHLAVLPVVGILQKEDNSVEPSW